MGRSIRVIDVNTGLDQDGSRLEVEDVIQMLLHGWDMREVVVGEKAVTPPYREKRRCQVWLGPAEPAIPLSYFLQGMKQVEQDGGDVVTLNMLSLLITLHDLAYWMGEEDVATAGDMEQDTPSADGVWPVPGAQLH